MNRMIISLIASLGLAAAAVPPPNRGAIPAGTVIQIRTNETIDADNAAPGRLFTGVVVQNAVNNRGVVLIPKGSVAQLAVTDVSKHHLTLDLATITHGGRTYAVSSSPETIQVERNPASGRTNGPLSSWASARLRAG